MKTIKFFSMRFIMNFVKGLCYLGTLLSVLVFSTSVNATTSTYGWVGAGGPGSLTFFDTNILDAANFTVAFTSENVSNISYTFNNGASIEDADNFLGSSTLQGVSELGIAMFTATNSIVEDWTFDYLSVGTLTPLGISFIDSSTTGFVSCFAPPCPVDTETINFLGNFSNENNVGIWQLQTGPIPAEVWLFISSFAGLFGFRRAISKLITV